MFKMKFVLSTVVFVLASQAISGCQMSAQYPMVPDNQSVLGLEESGDFQTQAVRRKVRPTPRPTPTPRPRKTPKPKPTPKPKVTPTPSALPSPVISVAPTILPEASVQPSAEPTFVPSAVPSADVSVSPEPSPSATPTAIPSPLPVLLVIANQDFYYREYAEPRRELLAAGIPVVIAATERRASYPHPGSGQGNSSGEVMPDLRLDQVNASQYSAIVFAGGWGSSQYQYAFPGRYAHAAYNGNAATKLVVNNLINDFAAQNKYVMGICHGASVLAWARINGVSPLAGLRATGGPWVPDLIGPGPTSTRDYIEGNQGIYVPSRSVGDPNTAADDLIIEGRFITAEDYDTAELAGETLAQLLQAQ